MAPRNRSHSHRRRDNSRRTWLVYGGAIGAIFAAAAITIALVHSRSVPSTSEAAAPPTALIIQFNAPFGPRFAGEAVAAEEGFFGRVNLRPDFRFGRSSDDAIAAVVGGGASVGVADPISFLKARAAGQPIVAFAASYVENGTVFYALEKARVRSPEDFIGKRVARVNGTHATIFYDALLNMRGISRSDIRETGHSADVQALLSGAVDVIPGRVGLEAAALKRAGAGYSVVRLFDFGIHVPDLVYFATEKTVGDRPSVLVRLVEAVVAGWSKAYADVGAASRIVAAKGGLPIEEAAFELAEQRDFVITVGRRAMEFDQQQWKQLVRTLVDARQLDEYFDLSRAVNYAILKDAYRRPITFGGASAVPEPAPILGR